MHAICDINLIILSTNFMFLDIIHHPIFILKHRSLYVTKHSVSETGFCLRFQVKPTQLAQSIELVPVSGVRR
jgi:hypothetical protein